MKGTEKQVAWATDLLDKMHKEFSECKKIAPENMHGKFDEIENILAGSHACDIIDLLSGINESGQKYWIRFTYQLKFAGPENDAAQELKKKFYKNGGERK